MNFIKTSTCYNISFFKKQVTNEIKFMAIKDEVYGVLSMDELRSIKLEIFLELKPSSFLALCSSCGSDINSKDDLISCSTDGCLFKLCSKTNVIIILTKAIIVRILNEQVYL